MKTELFRVLSLIAFGLSFPLISIINVESQTDARGQTVRIKVEAGREIDLYSGSYALVIGVSNYTNGWDDLPDVVNDLVEVKKALVSHGFLVETLLNPTRSQFDSMVRDFIARFGQPRDNRLLFYFSGHGHTLQTNDNQQRELGYIVPADAPLPRSDNIGIFKSYAVSMNEINNYAEQIEAKHVLFVFDSCFSGSIFKSRSGVVPEPIRDKTSEPVRQFITAGTEKQRVPAVSIFRRVFVNGLRGEADTNRDGYITGVELGEYLHSEVTTLTKRQQTPQHGKILNPDLNQGDFVFVKVDVEPQIYTETVNGIQIEMVRVPADEFTMGSPINEDGRGTDEKLHKVRISQSFYMGKYEVTQVQWRAVSMLPKVKIELDTDPSKFKPDPSNIKKEDLPVEQINWEEAVEFCERLSKATGKKYRLPTEAEWEYACRAGTTGAYAGVLDDMAWFGDNSGRSRLNADELGRKDFNSYNRLVENGCQTHPVGQKKPNTWGLYDMHGNVWEWCLDWYSPDYYSHSPSVDPTGPSTGMKRVFRGGGWYNGAQVCRSAYRLRYDLPSERSSGLGFRLVSVPK